MKYIITFLFSIVLFSASAKDPPFMNKSPEEGLWEALEYYEIHHPEIVYAQAVLETGWFTSDGCRKRHNLFGLGDDRKKQFKYTHWSESVKAYKEKIQKRYRHGEDYYKFLQRIHYARSKRYIPKLKKVLKDVQSKSR